MMMVWSCFEMILLCLILLHYYLFHIIDLSGQIVNQIEWYGYAQNPRHHHVQYSSFWIYYQSPNPLQLHRTIMTSMVTNVSNVSQIETSAHLLTYGNSTEPQGTSMARFSAP